jgi:hypothetical protein
MERSWLQRCTAVAVVVRLKPAWLGYLVGARGSSRRSCSCVHVCMAEGCILVLGVALMLLCCRGGMKSVSAAHEHDKDFIEHNTCGVT